jgi:rod shape-determining protein MreD
VRRPVAVRVVGSFELLLRPALIAVALTIVLATPVEMFGLTLPEPVLPLVLAFAWPLIRPSMLAPGVLFALGLFLDIFWGGALGTWPLALITVYAIVLGSRNLLAGQETRVLFAWYAICCAIAFFLVYLIVSMEAGRAPSLIALLWQVVPTLVFFPAADWMVQRFDDGDVRFR